MQTGNAIDAFVLDELKVAGLTQAKRVDRVTLIRRVTLDLTGLPPTPEQIEAFVNDNRTDAYVKLVDRLLASPDYGERWARHWLDVVRYSETNGYERDGAKPEAWRYRDYVIDALNADKPYDRFLIEQIAGDELPDASPSSRIATTFLRLGTWDDEPAEPKLDRLEQLDDIVGTTATVFMGLTLRCARCHDHKFEPFTQADYYRTLAIFDPLKRPQTGRDEHTVNVDTDATLKALTRRRLEQTSVVPIGLGVMPVLLKTLPETGTMAYIFVEEAKPPITRILKRGNPLQPLAAIDPGVPGVLKPAPGGSPKASAKTSGRRLWFANWLAKPDHPLTARVMVNRIWQGHFGRGLVESSNDFGTAGDDPSHAKLLDWLASEFVDRGWSIKAMHRLIVGSNTYQLSSEADATTLAGDPDNVLLTRWRRRRREAEAVRDSILAVSGNLKHDRGGPSVFPTIPQAVLDGQSRPGEGWTTSPADKATRRSIYVFAKRALVPPELELLDTPDTTSSCERRPVSTTGPQALTYLNSDFIQNQARQFATRLAKEAGPNKDAQITLAFRLTTGRAPSSADLKTSASYLNEQAKLIRVESKNVVSELEARQKALQAFALVVLNLNEFVFLD
jgi:hypothetical protein